MREGSTGRLASGDISIYKKWEYQPRFSTLGERIKEDSWGDTWKIIIWLQEETSEAGEYLLTPNKIPYQLPTNLE